MKQTKCRFVLFVVALLLPGCQQETNSRQAVVSGGSMAPGLLGEHFSIVCDDCRYVFDCDAARLPDNGLAVCPNCGFGEIKLAGRQRLPASTAEIIALESSPEKKIVRGDVVAFGIGGEESDKIGVKRVVGLPREQIQIRNGDIFVNRKLFTKPVELQRSVRIPVFDSNHVPQTRGLPARLVTESSDTLWDNYIQTYFAYNEQSDRSGIRVAPPLDWITYRHWRCCRHRDDRTREFPVEDYYAYNQAGSRDLNPTDELFFRMDVDCKVNAIVLFSVPHSGVKFKASIDVAHRRVAFYNPLGGQDSFNFDARIGQTPTVIEITTIDHTFVMLIDGVQVIRQKIFFPGTVNDVSVATFGIAASKGTFKLNRLQIWRDVYYLNEGAFYADGDPDKPLVCGEKQYILLGDNSPLSADSRSWEQPAVSAGQIVGVVETLPSR